MQGADAEQLWLGGPEKRKDTRGVDSGQNRELEGLSGGPSLLGPPGGSVYSSSTGNGVDLFARGPSAEQTSESRIPGQ